MSFLSSLAPIAATGAKVLGGLFGASSAKKAAKKQYEHQKEFAQNSVQWRVEDAKKAGINPIYAMGATGAAYQPVSTSGPSALESVFENVGQGLDRAAAVGKTRTERVSSLVRRQQQLTVENMGLQNDFLRAKIALAKQPGTPPGMPNNPLLNAGIQGDFEPLVNNKKQDRIAPTPGAPHKEPGIVSDVSHGITADGSYPIYPSMDAKDRSEDMAPSEIAWFIRNGFMPIFGKNFAPPFKPPKGKEWTFDAFRQAYVLRDKAKSKPGDKVHLRRSDGSTLFRIRKR